MMKTLFAFLLLTATASAATFEAWVSESWKANATNWTVHVVDKDGALAGKDVAAVETDLGVGAGANVKGTIDLASLTSDQWVTVVWYDADTPTYEAAIRTYWVTSAGAVTNPNELIHTDTQQLITDVALVKADTGPLATDWADGGRLDLLLDLAVSQTTSTALAVSVWDVAAANHNIVDTMGALLNAAGSGGIDPSQIAAAVWDALLIDHADPNSFGKAINDILAAVGGINLQFDYAAPDNISNVRTLFINGTTSTSIAEVNRWSSGVVTVACDCDNVNTLNPGTTITSVVSATVISDSDASQTPTSDLRIQQNRRKANFSIDPINAAGWHTCAVTVMTSDGQTMTFTGKLQVK